MPVWTATRIAMLFHLRESGMGFSQIGRRMGITKNAAIGKHRRLSREKQGLPPDYKQPIKRKSTTKKHYRKKVVHLPHPEPPPPKEFVLKKTKKVEVIVELPVHPIPAHEKRAMVKALFKLHEKVQQLSRMECNYPIGQPSKPDFTYCFAPVTQYGKSYCDEHCDLCFSKPAPRVKRPNYAPSGSGRRFR